MRSSKSASCLYYFFLNSVINEIAHDKHQISDGKNDPTHSINPNPSMNDATRPSTSDFHLQQKWPFLYSLLPL